MSSTLNERRKLLEDLDDFLNNSKAKLSSIVLTLGWSMESISKNVEKMVVCPFNDSHRIPERSLITHLENCQWKAEGYEEEDLPLSIPTLPPESSHAVKFDEQLQDNVIQTAKHQNPAMITGAGGRLIPRTSDRLITDFTKDERLAMYEYVVANTVQPDIGEDIADMNKPKAPDGKTSSYLELLAQERNLKRRRAKYRGVHTNKKSQVEILREVINQQMEMLAEYIAEKNEDTVNETENFSHNRETDKHEEMRNFDNTKNEGFAVNKNLPKSADNNGGQFQARSSKRSEDLGFHRGTSSDRGFDRGNGFRESCEKNEFTRDKSKYSNEKNQRERSRRVSSEKMSRSSRHKSHKHRSTDRNEKRHKRHRSRDREKSRSSRDSKYDEKRSKSSRSSRHDDRRSKKRKRSRDR